MAVTLSASVIAAIRLAGDNPRTTDEWIIAALNLGGILATGDIKSDGSIAFTGQETFGAGLKTGSLNEVLPNLGILIGAVAESSGSAMMIFPASSGVSTWGVHIHFNPTTTPTSPADGDFWFDGTDFNARIGGVTRIFNVT